MVHKIELAPIQMQALAENLSTNEPTENFPAKFFPMQLFAALANLGDEGFPILSDLAKNHLFSPPKNPIKFAHIAIRVPSLELLIPEVLKILEKGDLAISSDFFSEKPEKAPAKENLPLVKIEADSGKTLGKEGAGSRLAEQSLGAKLANPILGKSTSEAGLATPAIMNTVKQVLTILHYFAEHIQDLKSERLTAFQKIFQPLIDQLVGPVKESFEGKFESKNREIPSQPRTEKTLPKEKSLPLPTDPRQAMKQGERPLNHQRVQPNQPAQNQERPTPPENSFANRAQDFFGPKPTPSHDSSRAQEKSNQQLPLIAPAERTTIPAAPFTPQESISTAPRREKKKPSDPDSRDEEDYEDPEEDTL